MATTHIFVVDTNTFKYHLEYLFVGTGAKNEIVDFNNSAETNLSFVKENDLAAMIADSQRIRKDDNIIFYLQKSPKNEGRFYGIFKVKSEAAFLDNNDDGQFLKKEIGKSLTFRAIIEPYEVYSEGVSEWEALDDIKSIEFPYQMLWSLIYRSLKGNRGNTMITIPEEKKLLGLIRDKNHGIVLCGSNFTFNAKEQRIENLNSQNKYSGRQTEINVLPRLISKFQKGNRFESLMQAHILKNIENIKNASGDFIFKNIEWVGNEVSCGVSMKSISILVSENLENRKIIPIEIKSKQALSEAVEQMRYFVDWLKMYYIHARPSRIEPMIIALKWQRRTGKYKKFVEKMIEFNNANDMRIKYIEFEIKGDEILFEEMDY